MELVREYARQQFRAGVCHAGWRGISIWFIPSALRQVAMTRIWPRKSPRPFSSFWRKRPEITRRQNHFARLALSHRALCRANALKKPDGRRQRREQEAYMQSTLNEPDRTNLAANRAAAGSGAWRDWTRRTATPSCCAFLKTKALSEVGAALGASEEAREKAREPRAGKTAAIILRSAALTSTAAIDRRGDFRQFRSSRARGAGKIRNCRGAGQGRGGFDFNLNPHQRSIENYGMDKSKNGGRRDSGGVTHGGNRHGGGEATSRTRTSFRPAALAGFRCR